MTELILRKAIVIDLGNVEHLYKSVIGQIGCAWNEKYPSAEDIMNDYNAGCLYVFSNKYQTIGAVSVVPENELDDIDYWTIKDGTHKEIARVVISPSFQGKGYSKKMLLQLFSILSAQGCKAIHLLVSKENPAAINLYKALGFCFLGECYRYEHSYFICEKELIIFIKQ